MSNTPTSAALREPTKKETRLGWWFMRRFRPREVARRTARNEVMAAAWMVLLRYDTWAALDTPEAADFFRAARDRLARSFDAYNEVEDSS